MDTSYLAQQVNSSISQLHGLFDEIGVPNHEREARESELFEALSEALESQVRHVNGEKKELIDEAKKIINTIRQMEASLDDTKPFRRASHDDDDDPDNDLRITYPLIRCLQQLKEKHAQIHRLHKDRFEQVKKLVEALESYSSHLEATFVKIALPPTGPNQSIPPTFDLSPSYVDKLDAEFTRVYEEYTRRIATVQGMADQIIQLWAELGVPQAQQDGAIVKYYREAPEQLGLHEEDIARMRSKRDRLSEEKKNREKRLKDLRTAVEALWLKLDVDPAETKPFLNQNRGCGIRQINEFEDELARLNELKRKNMHLFVEDARVKLQDLWDALYFSEDEMLEFTPAFSDVYSDALLEAHEREVSRLEALKEQRAPTLALIDRHKSLVKERNDLQASSQDASRLMMRGQKGEKRDPGKLLREEKMRKRITKELPKVILEMRKQLERWEDEYGRPFLVFGERYLDEIEAEDSNNTARPGTARSKTPAGPPASIPKSAIKPPPSRTNSTKSIPPPRANGAKTPTTVKRTVNAGKTPGGGNTTMTTTTANTMASARSGAGSPSRIPARVPLSNMKTGNNSPERSRPESRGDRLHNGAPLRAPPPKMRDLRSAPPPLETPVNQYKGAGLVRQTELEDVYDDHSRPPTRSDSHRNQYYDDENEKDHDRYATIRASHQVNLQQQHNLSRTNTASSYSQAPPPRITSNTSYTSTAISGSENWETYDDNSEVEPEPDASDAYYAKVRAAAARGKRLPDSDRPGTSYGHGMGGAAGGPGTLAGMAKRVRGLPPASERGGVVMIDGQGNRIISGSEWTDEDAF